MESGRKISYKRECGLNEDNASSMIQEVLKVLEKGKLLDASEIAKRSNIPNEEIDKVLKCMIKVGFVKYHFGITKLGLNILSLPPPPE